MTKLFRAAILGAPASGKGTISSKITKHFDVTHISTGDIFRQNILDETQMGKTVQKYMDDAKLVPDPLVMKIVLTKLKELEDRNWLFDGFPRTLTQAEKLFMTYPLNLVINLKVPFEVLIDRAKGRRIHVPSGRIYNKDFHPPKVHGKDDITGEPLVQRPDDKPEAVMERLNIYSQMTGPLLKYYKKKGILREFSGRTSDEIWPSVEDTLMKFLNKKM